MCFRLSFRISREKLLLLVFAVYLFMKYLRKVLRWKPHPYQLTPFILFIFCECFCTQNRGRANDTQLYKNSRLIFLQIPVCSGHAFTLLRSNFVRGRETGVRAICHPTIVFIGVDIDAALVRPNATGLPPSLVPNLSEPLLRTGTDRFLFFSWKAAQTESRSNTSDAA